MCLPAKTDRTSTTQGPGVGSMLGIGGLMLLACLGAPALTGVLGGLGIGVLLGAGGAVFALALCAVVPAAVIASRRRSARRPPAPEL